MIFFHYSCCQNHKLHVFMQIKKCRIFLNFSIWIFDVFMILAKTDLPFNGLRALVRLYTFLKGQILQEC